MTDSLAPKSDQLDAVDLLSGPRTFTIENVSKHNAEQPFNFHFKEFPRVWRPGKSMRRVIVAAWGSKGANYVGKRLTLYCDPSVEFGGAAVGGSRISHMSGIDKPLKVPLLIRQGRSAMFTVQPLTEPVKRDFLAEAEQANGDVDLLRALWKAAVAAKEPQEHLDTIQAMAMPHEQAV
ncbi:hypothetical protein AB4Z38_06900 [Arthrobacter sp. 2RAF6]|uniref:hypothetical protein n=1 Tax=Arthrobacter sp. 2RAF6 TaxID=3233002 RepID=UPI003F8E572F